MMNPIAFSMLVFGGVLLLLGLLVVLPRRKVIGIAISLSGIGVAAIPFLVSFHLTR